MSPCKDIGHPDMARKEERPRQTKTETPNKDQDKQRPRQVLSRKLCFTHLNATDLGSGQELQGRSLQSEACQWAGLVSHWCRHRKIKRVELTAETWKLGATHHSLPFLGCTPHQIHPGRTQQRGSTQRGTCPKTCGPIAALHNGGRTERV